MFWFFFFITFAESAAAESSAAAVSESAAAQSSAGKLIFINLQKFYFKHKNTQNVFSQKTYFKLWERKVVVKK